MIDRMTALLSNRKILFLISALWMSTAALDARAADTLTWTGCGITKKAFMKELAAAFKKKTGIDVQLSGGGASKGIRFAASALADVGGACRHRLFVNEQVVGTELRTRLYQVAWDALVVITHKDNPVDTITVDQLKQVYNGHIKNWAALHGPDKPIRLATRKGKYSGVGQMFRSLVFHYQEYDFLASSKQFPSSGPLEKYVAATPYSLAMDGISSARKRPVKVLALDGVRPTKANIANGTYPLFRPLYLVTNSRPSAPVKKLIAFALSKEGQRIISEQGTVNLEEGRALFPLWREKAKRYGIFAENNNDDFKASGVTALDLR